MKIMPVDDVLGTLNKSQRINAKSFFNLGLTLMRDEFLSLILSGSAKNEKEIAARAEQLLLALPEGEYFLAVVKLIDLEDRVNERYKGDWAVFYFAARNLLEECLQECKGTVFRNQQRSNEFVLLCPVSCIRTEELSKWIQSIHLSLEACLRVKAAYGVSPFKKGLSEISKAYCEAVHSIGNIILGSKTNWTRYSHEPQEKDSPDNPPEWRDLNCMLECISETGTLYAGQNLVGKLYEAFHEEVLSKMSIHGIEKAVSELLDKIGKAGANSEEITLLLPQVANSMSELKTGRVRDLLSRCADLLQRDLSFDSRLKSGKQLVYAIKKYAEENFRTVSLEEISHRFYMNKNYLCSLFRNTTGENFSDFLVRIRMDRAKLLLAHSGLKTYEVANLVGYQDPKYFSQVFRKILGVHPTEYRRAREEVLRENIG